MKKSKYRGHKAEDLLIIAVARGIACYLQYLWIKGADTISYEALLRLPLSEIVGAKGWSYLCEYKLKNDSSHKKGAFKKVDFVLSYYDQVIGIELKLLKKDGNGKQSINLNYDYEKLEKSFVNDSGIKMFSKKYSYIIIVGSEEVFSKLEIKGVNITKTVQDSDIVENKKNILKENEAYKTKIDVGNRGIIVEAIKVKTSISKPSK
jgi:hypothetical protein